MSFRRLLPVATFLFCATLPLAFADQVVYFVNGKAIMVKSVEKGDKVTLLEMEGGGKIGVPTDQIVKIEDFMVTAPQAPPVVPVQSAPAPVPPAPIAATAPGPVTAPPAFASGVPAAPLMAPGPGVGGKPAGGPNDNIAHIQPLDIGGNNASGPMQRQYPQGMGPRSAGPGGPMLGPGPRANLPPGGRRFGRGFPAGGRGGRTDTPAPPTPPQAAQPAPQPQATQPAAAPTPEPAVEPEAPPAPPDDSNNEEPSDPPAPEQGDPSGNTPGGAN